MLKKLLIAIALVIGVGILVFFLTTGRGPDDIESPDAPNKQAKQPSHDKVRPGAVEPDRVGGSTDSASQPPASIEDAKVLLDTLRAAIAGGDWQHAKELCEKLAAMPAAYNLLVDILLDNASMEEEGIGLRWRAAYILGLMGNKRAIAVFEQALVSEKALDVRSNIVLALGMFKDPQTRPALESVFLDGEEDPGLRQSATQYLAQISGGAAILVDILNSESTKELKQFVVKGLAFSADKAQAAATLTDLLSNREKDAVLRRAAARSLGTLGEPGTIGALIAALQEDADFRVRNTCATALGNFGGNNEILSALSTALHNDKDPTVRGCAAQALGTLESEQAVGDLKEALKRDRHRVVRVRIVEALGRIGGEEAKKILQNRAENDPSVHVRNVARKALGKAGKQE
jgi:HEAT repeat protein